MPGAEKWPSLTCNVRPKRMMDAASQGREGVRREPDALFCVGKSCSPMYPYEGRDPYTASPLPL
jgi:hypothetical protein